VLVFSGQAVTCEVTQTCHEDARPMAREAMVITRPTGYLPLQSARSASVTNSKRDEAHLEDENWAEALARLGSSDKSHCGHS